VNKGEWTTEDTTQREMEGDCRSPVNNSPPMASVIPVMWRKYYSGFAASVPMYNFTARDCM
jgi:hypothetical protein